MGGLLIFLVGISWGGSYYAWKSTHVIATIVLGFFALVAFVLYESLVPLKEPLVPMHLFKNIPWVATMMVLALGAIVYYAFAIVWPTMVFSLYTSDLTHGGYLCCVTGCGTNAGQIVGGNLCRRLGRQKMQIVVATICMGTFLGGKQFPNLKFFALMFSDSLATCSLCLCYPRQPEHNGGLPLPGLLLIGLDGSRRATNYWYRN